MRRALVGVCLGLGLACSESEEPPASELPPADFAPHCGRDGPVQLVELGEHETLGLPRSVSPDLWAIFVERCRDEACEVPELDAVFFDACSQRGRVPADVQFLYDTFDAPHDVVLACDHNGHVVGIDPDEIATTLVMTGVGCQATPVGTGMAGLQPTGEQTARIVFRTSVEELDAPLQLLADDARWPGGEARPWERDVTLRGGAERLLYLSADGRLVEIEVASNERRDVIDGVSAFDVSADFRFVAIQGSEPFTAGLDNYPLVLLDREGGVDVALGWSKIDGNRKWVLRDGYAVAYADPAFGGQRVTLLPELDQLLLGADRTVQGRLEDGRLVLEDAIGALVLVDAVTGDEQLLFAGARAYASTAPGGFDVFARGTTIGGSALFYVPEQTMEPRLIVDGIDGYLRIDDSRVAVVSPPLGGNAGTLTVVDLTTHERFFVSSTATLSSGTGLSSWEPPMGEGTLLYRVAAGDEAGLWVGRFE